MTWERIDDLMQQIIDEHVAAYHPGRQCRENERGQCADRPWPNEPVPTEGEQEQ